MAQLTFPLSAGELKLLVVIGHTQTALANLIAAGGPLPRPLWATGVIDTGTNVTCVAPALLQQLGLTLTGQGTSQTAGGLVAANLFEVSLSIPPPGTVQGPLLTRQNLLVMEMPSPIPGVEVLIGLDILLTCKLVLDGPGGYFTLDF